KKAVGPRGLLAAFLACRRALNDSQNLVLAHDQELFVVEFDFGAAVLAEQHSISRFDVESLTGSVVAIFALANGHYFALLGLFLRGIGNNNSAANLFTFVDSPHNHTVVKRPDIYCHT